MKDRLEPYARRFATFAVPGPDASPAELRRRGRLVGACAIAVIVIASMFYAYIGNQRQQALISAAVALRNEQTCQKIQNNVLIACLAPAQWVSAGADVQNAWIAGEAYTNPTVLAIHVQGPDRETIFDQVIRKAPPVPRHT